LKYRDFYEKYIGGICRDCLNTNTGLRLASSQCAHSWREKRCSQCGDLRYPIIGLKPLGRLRILFYRNKTK